MDADSSSSCFNYLVPLVDVTAKFSEQFDVLKISREICSAISSSVDCEKSAGQEVHFGLRLSHDDEVHELNKTYRGKDKTTNILAFPLEVDDYSQHDENIFYAGDLIMALGVLERESQEQGKTVKDHFSHLLIHGVLHLYGFDHLDEAEAEEMEALEISILSKLGVSNPYKSNE